MFFRLLCLVPIFSAAKCGNVIYHLNDTEYKRMPAVIQREDTADCERYCAVDAVVLPGNNTDLYDIIVRYTARVETHYNHTKLRHGICVSRSCNHIYTNTSLGRTESLEACLNETLMRDYGLQAKVTDHFCDDDLAITRTMDNGDFVMITVIAALLILNIIGTLQGIIIKDKDHHNKFLQCFSIQSNMRILLAPRKAAEDESDLKAIYGIRFLTMLIIVQGHQTILLAFTDTGHHFFEKAYAFYQYLMEGTVIVQTFFVISAYFVTNALLKISEKAPLKATAIPIFILKRWLRLTPTYLFVFGLTATLLRFAIDNPLSQLLIGRHVTDCRRDWWMMMLYINNYNDDSNCMIEAWYVQTDFYMSIVAVSLMILLQGKTRIAVLLVLLNAGNLAAMYYTYIYDLDGTILTSPETFLNFMDNKTFNMVYKRTHTNTYAYMIGIMAALWVYHRRKSNKSKSDTPNIVLRIYFWSIPILGLLCVISGCIFFTEGPRLSVHIRGAWALNHKGVFATGVALLIIAQFRRSGGWLTELLRWKLWVTPARLGYCAYLCNLFAARLYIAAYTTVPYTNTMGMYAYTATLHLFCYALAIPLWLLVEAPSVNVTSLIFASMIKKKVDVEKKEEVEEDSKKTVQFTVVNGNN